MIERERTCATLTPMMATALRAAARGGLICTADGWIPIDNASGRWNSHTVLWLAGKGYLTIVGRRSTMTGGAAITDAGRTALWNVGT